MLYDAKHGNGGVVTPRFRAASQLAEKVRGEGRISASWASGDCMGNWFSVNQRDAVRTGLDSYDAGDTNQFRAGVLVNYTF